MDINCPECNELLDDVGYISVVIDEQFPVKCVECGHAFFVVRLYGPGLVIAEDGLGVGMRGDDG